MTKVLACSGIALVGLVSAKIEHTLSPGANWQCCHLGLGFRAYQAVYLLGAYRIRLYAGLPISEQRHLNHTATRQIPHQINSEAAWPWAIRGEAHR